MTIRNICLPQNDKQSERRQLWLADNRASYQYNHDYLPPIPLVDELPKQEESTYRYTLERKLATAPIRANLAAAKVRTIFDPFDEIDDFDDLYPLLPQPTSLNTWRTDGSFAEQRISGTNPMKIRRLTHSSEVPFPMLGILPGTQQTAEAAIQSGRLYLADYSDLSFVQGGKYLNRQKYLPAPVALFYWSTDHMGASLKQLTGYSGQGELLPIAIQIKSGGPIYTPYNVGPIDWLIAKLCVQVADANQHEMSSHLCLTHLVMEAFGIATARHLAENHPLGVLLRPHFRFMMDQNNLGMRVLINKGGLVDKLLAGTIEESWTIIKHAYEGWSFKEFAFPTELKNRHMDDSDLLPHYPYRDDGMLLWNAVHRYVRDYLSLYYQTDTDVQQDKELRAWADELSSPSLGRVKDMPQVIETKAELVDIVANIIFTCGPQHAAVNFSQYDYLGFVPNMPAAAYCPVPGQNDPKTEALLLNFLPPAEQARGQLELVYALTAYQYDRLGFYEEGMFTDPAALQVIETFQQNLAQIEKRINLRNERRLAPYKFMKPSEILNSLSI